MRRWGFLVVLVACAVFLAGCSLVDGMTGQPVNVATDSPTWYHIGQLITPVLSALLALGRILLPILLPLLL